LWRYFDLLYYTANKEKDNVLFIGIFCIVPFKNIVFSTTRVHTVGYMGQASSEGDEAK
jgi:hypothetical protein